MTLGIIFVVLALAAAIASLVLIARSNIDKRRAAIGTRLRTLTAPTRSKVIAPEIEILSPDPWLQSLPETWRPRIDRILGSTGYTVTLKMLAIISGGGVVAGLVAGVVMHLGLVFTLLAVVFGGLIVPWQFVKSAKSRNMTRFTQRFPDAIDLIVRAVRAGLPVLASMEAAGAETPEPVGREFRRMIADTRIGITVEEALARAAMRIGLIEFNFFVASIQLQRESGGNLTETLSTLSNVLRRRDELRAKTRALTAEARLSAMVLAAMPFVTAGAIMVITPGYFKPLFTDPTGSYILGAALCSITFAMLTMRTMLRKAMA
ncbi:MAG TPA: type II secretion system F family protein [Stellaceae bacterium]